MRSNRIMIIVIKGLVLAGSMIFIVYKLIFYKNISAFLTDFSRDLKCNEAFLIIAAILMAVNWILESYKWKILTGKLETVSMIKALKAIFTGITVSIFTPNRIGEFAGRVLFLKKENRIRGVFSTITGNISQLAITVIAGMVSLVIILTRYRNVFYFSFSSERIVLIITMIILIIPVIYFYFNIRVLDNLFSGMPYIKKFRKYFHVLSTYTRIELAYVLFISLVRYMVFILQFYLVLVFFDVHLGFFVSFISIATIYIFLAIIPTFAFTEITVRSSLALIVLGMFSGDITGIAFASILVWIINLAFPALIGVLFFYKIKIAL